MKEVVVMKCTKSLRRVSPRARRPMQCFHTAATAPATLDLSHAKGSDLSEERTIEEDRAGLGVNHL